MLAPRGVDVLLSSRAVPLPAMLVLAALLPSDGGIALQWEAPAQCPDVEDVRGWMRDDDVIAQAPVEVAVVIDARDDGFEMSLAIAGPMGTTQRRLEHRDCEELARTAVLVIAVAADPLRSLAPAREEVVAPAPAAELPDAAPIAEVAVPVDAPAVAAIDEVLADPRPPTPPPPPRRRRPWIGVGAEGGVAWGLAPSVTGTLGGAIAIGDRRWRVALGALHTLAAPARFADLPGVGADVSTTRATLRGCGRIGARRVALSPCGGVEFGATRGVGVGLPVTQTQTAAWVALTLHAMIEVELARRVALWLAPNLVAPMTRPAFDIRGREDAVWRTPRLTGGLNMGVELRFGGDRRFSRRR